MRYLIPIGDTDRVEVRESKGGDIEVTLFRCDEDGKLEDGTRMEFTKPEWSEVMEAVDKLVADTSS